MTRTDTATAADEYTDHGYWVDCWQCGGDGELEDCFEDTCVCVDPPCYTTRCDICRGKGGWYSEEPDGDFD